MHGGGSSTTNRRGESRLTKIRRSRYIPVCGGGRTAGRNRCAGTSHRIREKCSHGVLHTPPQGQTSPLISWKPLRGSIYLRILDTRKLPRLSIYSSPLRAPFVRPSRPGSSFFLSMPLSRSLCRFLATFRLSHFFPLYFAQAFYNEALVYSRGQGAAAAATAEDLESRGARRSRDAVSLFLGI